MNKIIYFFVFLVLISACSAERTQLKPLKQSSSILAFGDSLTYGTGAKKTESYPYILQKLTGLEVINEGVPGEISVDGKKRLSKLLKKHKPDLVILCHGGNDLLRKLDLSQTRNNLKSMINMITASGAEAVILSVPRPGLLLKPAPLYEALADETQTAIIVGLLTDILSDRTLKSDTAHPNAKGYSKMAQAVAELLVERKAVSQLK